MELPSSDLAKKKVCHISQLFSKSSTMCRPKNATSANFFQKAQLCVTPKCHISQLFSKSSTMCCPKMPHQPTFFKKLNYVLPKNATSAIFFQKAQLCVAQKCHISQPFSNSSIMCRPKMPHQPPFFKKLNYVSPCHKSVTNVIWQTPTPPFKIGTSVCGLCSQPLKCELLKNLQVFYFC